MAIHRTFDSPRDRVVFDTGHQAYVHKMLTGRAAEFDGLRREGGLSGYPSQAESPHDIVENSHASTALSYADGLAKAYAIRGEDRHVVAVIGDGALTGGMAWEALNNIAIADSRRAGHRRQRQRPLLHARPSAASPPRSRRLRTSPRYEQVLDLVKKRLNAVKGVGPAAYDALHAMKKGVKDALAPQGLFEDLGLKYVGPVDGHDRAAMEHALAQAKKFNGPVIVHALTRKGFGYDAAERHEADQFHPAGPFDPDTGEENPKGHIWTNAFTDEIVRIGQRRKDVVAITAAMMHPVGLHQFQARFPERTFDVGIAEQHAATSAAGLAMGGLHPVVAHLRDVPQPGLRPGADGLRPAPVRRHLRARPGRRHRRRRRQPQRHVGHVDPPGRARPAAGRAPRRHPAPRAAQRGRRRRRRARPWSASPRARRPTTSRRSTGSAASTSWSARAPATCSWSRSARWPTTAVDVADRLVGPGHRRHRRRPALGQARRPGARRPGPRPPARGQHRGQRRDRRLRRGPAPDPQRRRRRHAVPAARASRSSSSRHAKRARILEQVGLTPQALALGIVEDITALAEGRGAGRCRPSGLALGRSWSWPCSAGAGRLLALLRRRTTPTRRPAAATRAARRAGRARRAALDQRADAVRRRRRPRRSWPGWRRATGRCAAEQRTYFANLVQLPLGTFDYDARPGRRRPRRRRLPGRGRAAHRAGRVRRAPGASPGTGSVHRGRVGRGSTSSPRPPTRRGRPSTTSGRSPGTSARSWSAPCPACSASSTRTASRPRTALLADVQQGITDVSAVVPSTGRGRWWSTRSPTRRTSPRSRTCPAATRAPSTASRSR